MGNPNRNRTRGTKEQPALQLSSYQLVMAICALLLLMCALFIAGILVQRFTGDAGSAPVASNTETAETSERAPTGPVASQGEGTQVAPRPVTLPPESDEIRGSGSTAKRSESNAKYIPAPPPRRDRNEVTSTKPDTPSPEPSKQTATNEASPVTQPATAPTAPEMPAEPAAPVPPPSASETVPAAPEATTEETSAPAEPATTPQNDAPTAAGPFAIQVASFDSNNLERAKRFKDDTEKETDFTVNLVPSADGKHVRAFVGEYPDRAAADSARDAMRKVKGFEDCFVKSLGEE